MTKPLASRIALVTGASRGIGYATSIALAKAGAHVVVTARTQGGLEELDDEIRKVGGSATLVPLNLTDFDGIARLGAALHERHGKIDILVGNAGVAGPSSPLGHIELKPWNDVMAVNVTANFQLIRCVEPLLKQSDAGRAVFVTSGAANKASAYVGPYAASKAAIVGFTKSLAFDLASSGITVNAVLPGPIRTSRAISTNRREYGDNLEVGFRERAKAIPVGRFGTPEEVASMIAYLASDQAAFVTGQAIGVDGGW